MGALVVILVIVVLVFGVSSGMQSYATAQQAQATIETAKAAQVSAWGNLVVILVLALLIVTVLVVAVWMVYRRQRSMTGGQRTLPRVVQAPAIVPPASPASLELLIQLETLKALRTMNGTAHIPLQGAESQRDELHWLRKS